MRRFAKTLPLLLAMLQPAHGFGAPPPVHYVDSRQVILSSECPGGQEADQIRLWFSTEGSKTWESANATRTAKNAVQFNARQDGKYCFYIVLENKAGRSADPPADTAEPHLAVVVDTAPPTIQIHQARQISAPDGHQQIRLNVSLIEENLSEAAVRLFYRANPKTRWQDGGAVLFAQGIIDWRLPADIGPQIDICLLVTDLAGNRASDEIRDINIKPGPPAAPPSPPKSSRAVEQTTGTATEAAAAQAKLDVAPVRPVTVAPLPTVTLAEEAEPTPARQWPPETDRQAQRLRELAARYLAQGRLSLADARLQDALELTPNDADLQVDLGSVLYRARRYDEARRLFQDAVAASPEHLGAIEGLALVAATQNRYPQARTHLQHLLRLSPGSGKHWLYYGDIEHKLGNAAEADAAWEKALEFEPADKAIREKVDKRLKLFGRERADSQ